MLTRLKRHPESHGEAIEGIEVEVTRSGDALALRYVAAGAIDAIILPEPAAPARADELWKHSCFEAFLRSESEPGYLELNFAPSSQWAAYRFDSYRNGMAPAEVAPPRIDVCAGAGRFELLATIALPPLRAPVRLNLAAIVEARDGRKSYWALAHPPGDPDFHQPDCFVLELPPPSRA